MKKNITLAIPLILFLIPELLWSPLMNINLGFFIPNYIFRQTAIADFGANTISFILGVQALGLLILSFLCLKFFYNSKKIVFLFLGIFVSLLTVVAMFDVWVSLALRSIGF